MFSEKDIPASIKTDLAKIEKEFAQGDLSIALLSIAAQIASDNPDWSKLQVFTEALEALSMELDRSSDTVSFKDVLVIGPEKPTNWNERYIESLTKEWKSMDVATRNRLKAEGHVLTVDVVDPDTGERSKAVVSKLANYSFNYKTGEIIYKDSDVTLWQSESDPVVFIDMREKKPNGLPNRKYKSVLTDSWSCSVIAIVTTKDSSGKDVQRLAKISLFGDAANPFSPKNRLREFASMSFKYYKGLVAKISSDNDNVITLDSKNLKFGPEGPAPSINDIKKLLLSMPMFTKIDSTTLAEWINKYATKESDVENKYSHYLVTEMTIHRLQTFQQSGNEQLHLKDAAMLKSEYDITAQTPTGTTIADYGIVPGSKILIVGRAFFRNSVINNKTGQREKKQWPSIDIVGAKQYLDMKKYQVDELLRGIGLKTETGSFVDEDD